MTKNRGLGTGFDSLIPTNFDADLLLDKEDRIQKLFIKDVEPNPDQPRKHFDEQALHELAQSIKQYGILQPLIVVPRGAAYSIIAGERRYRAAKLAGLKEVPVIIRDRKELEQLEIALIENVQRVDLSPLEQAVSIEKLHQQFNMNYAAIAERLGKAVPTIHNTVRLLQLPARARDMLQTGKISEGHARAILALKDFPKKQEILLDYIYKNGWSVRQAEQFVVGAKKGSEQTATNRTAIVNSDTKHISERLGTKVTIKHTAKGGRLELHFVSEQDLAKLIELLRKL